MDAALIRDSLTTIRRVLTPEEKAGLTRLVFLTLVGAVLDVLAVILMVPVMAVAIQPQLLREHGALSRVQAWSGVSEERWVLLGLLVGLLVFFVLKNVACLWVVDRQARYAYRVGGRLSEKLFFFYLSRPLEFHKETPALDVIQRTATEPGFFASGVILSLVMLATEIAVSGLILGLILIYKPLLFLMLVAILGPAVWGLYWLKQEKLADLALLRLKRSPEAYSRVGSALAGYVDIHLTNSARYFAGRYLETQQELNDGMRQQAALAILPARAMETVAILGFVVIFIFATFFAGAGGQEGMVVYVSLFATAAFRLMPSLNRILTSFMNLKSNRYTLEIVDVPESPRIEPLPLRFDRSIELRAVSFRHKGMSRDVLDQIAFTVRKGEIIGVIGESGSGKTTLMQILLRLYVESAGAVLVDGVPLEAGHTPAWQRRIGFVKQDVFLLDGTIRENIAFGQSPEQADSARLERAVEAARLGSLVRELPRGLDTPVGELGARLSGGQRQRIAIARALYKEADVLIFDEATSSLDNETEAAVTESINALAGGSLTVLIVAHRYTTLRDCNRIFEIEAGRVVREVRYTELQQRLNSLGQR